MTSMRGTLLILAILLGACQGQDSSTDGVNASAQDSGIRRALLSEGNSGSQPLLAAHRSRLKAIETAGEVALALEGLSAEATQAQTLVLTHPLMRQRQSQVPEWSRIEVFAVYPLKESDMVNASTGCQTSRCYRVELYDFPMQRSIYAAVDVKQNKVLGFSSAIGAKPEVPKRLADIAVELARNSSEVQEALGGHKPEAKEALMASTKTSLNNTRCERSLHLCVAPTFVQGNIAIWAIVDLTELKVVGVQWTEHGQPNAPPPTEQSLTDAVIMEQYCERNKKIERDGWSLDYMLTTSDGMQVSNAKFKDRAILQSAKLVDWHVNYSQREGFGYADAVGCPSFSSAAVIPWAKPQITDIKAGDSVVGFKLEQEFRSAGWPGACNYSYRQAFEFYRDGRFRPTAASIGAGCGNDGTYRPLLRLEFAGKQWDIESFNGQDFEKVPNERWFDANSAVNEQGTSLKLSGADGGFVMQPGRGQFQNAKGDDEFVYLTARPIATRGDIEGASDLPTLGSCCNNDHRQGPEQFIDAQPQPLRDGFVLWYVPQLKNDFAAGSEYCYATQKLVDGIATNFAFPCVAGPMFVPIE